MNSCSSSSVIRRSVCSINRCPSKCSISWQKHRAVRSESSTSRNHRFYPGLGRAHLRAGNHAVFPRYAQAALQSRLLSISENDLGFTSSMTSSSSFSTTHTRRRIPTWGAANPTPPESSSVSVMSSSSVCRRPLKSVTGRQTLVKHSSPCRTIFRSAIIHPPSCV